MNEYKTHLFELLDSKLISWDTYKVLINMALNGREFTQAEI